MTKNTISLSGYSFTTFQNSFIYLFTYLFIYLFIIVIYLFIYLFIYAKLRIYFLLLQQFKVIA